MILGAESHGLPADEASAFVHGVASALDEPVLDYVRLNIDARAAAR